MTERPVPTTSVSGEAVAAAWPDLFANLQAAYAKVIDTQFEMERRAAELEDSRDLLRQVIASMSEALFLLDRTGRVMQVNPAALALIDRTEADCAGQLFRKICPDPNAPISAWKILNSSAQGTLTGLETELRRSNGQMHPVNMSAAVVRNRNGRIEGVLIIAQDRRPQQQQHSERVQSEQRSATTQLAERLAEELAEPVKVIRGYSQHLQEICHLGDTIDEQLLADLQRVAAAADEMAQLVTHLRAIGRPAMGTFKPVDVNQLVQAVLLLVANHYHKQKIPIQLDLSESVPAVQGDWQELAFAVAELVQYLYEMMAGHLTNLQITTQAKNKQVCLQIIGTSASILVLAQFATPAYVQDVAARHNGQVEVEAEAQRLSLRICLPGLVHEP